MADDAARSRLGRGLAVADGRRRRRVASRTSASRAASARCRSNIVRANPRNPRKLFSDAELDELAASIRERGIIQPIVVRARGADNFEIIAGERRWRAAQRAGLHEVPIVVLDVTDGEALELAIIENVQRSRSQSAGRGDRLSVARQRVQSLAGRHRQDRRQEPQPHRQHAAAAKLPERVKAYINAGKLTAGHARMLVGQPIAEELARRDRQAGPERAPGRGAGAQERPKARRATASAPDGSARMPTPRRWRAGCPTRSGSLVRSTIAPRRRRAAGALSHARAARRRDPAAGKRLKFYSG